MRKSPFKRKSFIVTKYKNKPAQVIFYNRARKPRKPLQRVGKIGLTNLEANKILREKLGHITYCEMKLKGCLGSCPLQFAHRHKRTWYRGDVDKLSNTKQVVVAC